MKVYQSWNSKAGAWVKYRKYANGRCVITDIKQRDKKTPFSGVPKKNMK